ncbi:Cytochrome oxidase assembly family protein [Theileria parva strain Muguga]|uniref:Cytochrome oxidase assembly family protein n=1 Tax=Theileria parva strain Muguga TaxID=333668 RepID=UPI001C61D859|nr:Cytochrome oxidase assembly family protein [Theileria parva strain Muguga]EAN31339.2 Cytochrome oxidase assembly family protein [Theileria parva strain Muguga]
MPGKLKFFPKTSIYDQKFVNFLKSSFSIREHRCVSKNPPATHTGVNVGHVFPPTPKIPNLIRNVGFSTLNSTQFVLESPIVKRGFEKKVGWWLMGCSGLTAFIMGFGAYVRLNESGLSMIDWSFFGLPLPQNDSDWDLEFQKYKKTPEYKGVHYGISLEEYKNIFLKEWLHRMIGRGSGAFFALGCLYFSFKRCLKPRGYLLLTAIGTIGVYQAFVGKWMVESGFFEPKTENKTPRVSPYRLCFHFFNALAIYSLCFYNSINLLFGNLRSITPSKDLLRMKWLSGATAFLTLLTMAYGTFVAGNDSGLSYNTWPLMDGKFAPDQVLSIKSPRQFFENDAVLQFNHRNLAYLTVLSSLVTLVLSKKLNVPRSVSKLSMGVLHASLLQGLIGVLTVLNQVPLHGALAHHFNAVVLWSVILALLRVLK